MERWNSTFKTECGERFVMTAAAEEEVFDSIGGLLQSAASAPGNRVHQSGRAGEAISDGQAA